MALAEIGLNRDQQAIVESTGNIDWESITDSREGRLALNFIWAVTEVFQHYLVNPQLLVTDGLTQSWPKDYTDSHCYGYDLLAEAILGKIITTSEIPCLCYSEESGWTSYNRQADKPYFIAVVDPLDNSSNLARRISNPTDTRFHNQGAAITLADENNDFLCAALVDFQTGEIIFGEKGGVPILLTVDRQQPIIHPGKIQIRQLSATDPLAVGSLFEKEDRKEPLEATRLFGITRFCEHPQTLGAVALREFLTGKSHFLTDPYKGQPWHEMPIFALAQLAGGTVLDLEEDTDFSLTKLLVKAQQADDKVFRVRFVAGATRKKTEQLSRLLTR